MLVSTQDVIGVPEETERVAREAFPKGNVYMRMRDELGVLYQDSDFAHLFSRRGRPAESPGRLALVLVIQFAEGLTDRQVAEAIRARIDLKYALGLELTDPGFDYTVLSKFRDRVIEGSQERRLLDDMLQKFKDKGWLKARGRQRTDSTHVLSAARKLNRLECVGETLRRALDDLATLAPEWLLKQVSPDWFELYSRRFEQYRLPKEKAERVELGERIGADGYHLLSAIYAEDTAAWMREVPSVQILRQVWEQLYYIEQDRVYWRTRKEHGMVPSSQLIQSPDDPQARNRTKRDLNWTGYAVHLTETCDAHSPNVITNVETTPATTGDGKMTGSIHQALAEKGLLPSEHFVDTSYVSAQHLVESRDEYTLDLVGPTLPDGSWQARAQQGFDISCFAIDWERQTVTCPQGKISQGWYPRTYKGDQSIVEVHFKPEECMSCSQRSQCTKAVTAPRTLKFRPQAQFEALRLARQRQSTEAFKQIYKVRAGIEGTISQGSRSFDLRRSRYIGLPKTHLQHILTAVAMNLSRVFAWLQQTPRAQTRRSRFAALAHA